MIITNDRLGEIRNNRLGTPMKIIAYRTSDDIDVEFQDKFHYVKEHQTYSNFRGGGIKNPYDITVYGVGYIGAGKYKPMLNKDVIELRYNDWRNMLGRCYSEDDVNTDGLVHSARSEYTDEREYEVYHCCEVDERWFNYQNFSEWFEENKYECDERLQVDKDILFPNCKIYSPETCLLVSHRINVLFMNKKNDRGLPNGIRRTKGGRYSAKYNLENLGTYDTLEEVYAIYAIKKKENILRYAEEYKNIVSEKVYNALVNYEVRIENDKNYQK